MRIVWQWLKRNRQQLVRSVKLELELEPRMAHIPKLLAIALDGTDLEIENRGRSFALNQRFYSYKSNSTALRCSERNFFFQHLFSPLFARFFSTKLLKRSFII